MNYNTHVTFELLHKELQQMIVEVFAAKECITISWFDLEDTFLDLKDRDIESTATEIVHSNAANQFNHLKHTNKNKTICIAYILSSVLSKP